MQSTPLRIAAVTALAVVLVGCTSAAAGAWTFAPPASATPGAAASASAGATAAASASASEGTTQPSSPASSPAASGASAGTIEIQAFDLGFTPSAVTVPAAGTYDVNFDNTGAIPHNVTFADGTVISADPGETKSGTVTVPADGIAFICSIPGHEAAGMKGAVAVAGAAAASPSASAEQRFARWPAPGRRCRGRPECAPIRL